VADYYNGTTGGSGSSGGTNYGISFSSNALALIDADFGTGNTGNFANEPSPNTIMSFLSGNETTVNVAGGFKTAFSFWYTNLGVAGSVEVFDGLDGGGSSLGVIELDALSGVCNGDPKGQYCNWAVGAVSFTGLAKSIVFSAAAAYSGFDNVTFGAILPPGYPPTPMPEPLSLLLVATALGAVRLARRSPR
jgi:hypothetical protein